MVSGLSHITFLVRDLDRMETLLTSILGARKVFDSGEKKFSYSRERVFLIGDLWIAVMEGDAVVRSYNHLAFKIEEAEYDICRERILALGLELKEGRPRLDGEGRSLYFYDHDNHLFELHTGTLEQRLARYAKALDTGTSG